MKRKGQYTLGNLPGVVTLMVLAVLVLTFSALVINSVNDNLAAEEGGVGCNAVEKSNCTNADVNISQNGLAGLTNIGGQFGNTGTVIGAAIIIGILILAFTFGRGGISFSR